nr:neuronal acetylcholine receptor subunit beta-4-like; partial [Biomphalaria glabrata]
MSKQMSHTTALSAYIVAKHIGQTVKVATFPNLRTIYVDKESQGFYPALRLAKMLLLWILGFVTKCSGQNYSDGLEIMRTKLKADNYNPDLRPLINQSAIISVSVSFQLVSIVEVNDVTQSFVCNGFLPLTWTDEILAWEPSDYGGLMSIHPLPEAVWRPRVVLLNTIDKRDLFGDDKAPLNVESTGLTHWIPGSLFLTSCELDMTKYPFDKHTCFIQLIAMTYQTHELHFIAPKSPEVGLTFYTPHGEWNLLKTTIEAFNDTSGFVKYSSIKVKQLCYFCVTSVFNVS